MSTDFGRPLPRGNGWKRVSPFVGLGSTSVFEASVCVDLSFGLDGERSNSNWFKDLKSFGIKGTKIFLPTFIVNTRDTFHS